MEPWSPPPGHKWTKWEYDHKSKRWYRHCTYGKGNCSAVESLPRGAKRPK
jgi:hypothetical protein